MSDTEHIKKQAVRGAISYFLRTLLLQGLGLVSILILSAYFVPEDFAIYGFVIQIIGILIFFSDVGLAAALVQKKEEPTIVDYRTAFTLQQILSWLIVAVVFAISQHGFIQAKTGQVGVLILAALAFSFPMATLKTIPSVILERKLQFSKLIVPQIFEQIFFHGILIYLAINGSGAIAYVYAVIARSIIGVIVMWILQPWDIGLNINKSSLRSLLGFGVKFQINDFLARIKDQLFYLVLGLWLPLREFGFVQWAKNWSMYPYNLTVSNVMAVTFPAFSRLQHNKEALGKAIEKSIYFITLFIFPVVTGMAIFINPLINLVPKYQQWQPAIFSLAFFSFSIGLSAISTPLTNTLNAIGEINKTLKLMVMWTTLTWVLTPLFMNWFGFNGVALASFIISLTSVVPVWMVKKVIPFNFTSQISSQFMSTAVMGTLGLAGISIWSESWSKMLLGIVLCSVAYLVGILFFGYTKLVSEINSLRRSI